MHEGTRYLCALHNGSILAVQASWQAALAVQTPADASPMRHQPHAHCLPAASNEGEGGTSCSMAAAASGMGGSSAAARPTRSPSC